ncbi:MAG: hypothetical protein EOP56_11570 [Sphingobacteriales bacterium]|nr:MAG: hypothetical protein EOP56_11570 [Sphingobacteriales bacterium]
MKTAIRLLFVVSATALFAACKKPKQDLSEASGLGISNTTDQEVTMRFQASYSAYVNTRKTKSGYTITVPAGATIVAPFTYGTYFVDWYSSQYEVSNWGAILDTTTPNTSANAIHFKFDASNRNYKIAPSTARATYIDTGSGTTWKAVAGLKGSAKISDPGNMTLGINKGYTVSISYQKGKSYSLWTKTFGPDIVLTDSISQKYRISIIEGANRHLDTLLVAVPYSDTMFKLVKNSIK